MEVKLIVVGGKHAGMEIPVPGPKFLIGRGPECRLRPGNRLVSRRHCMIVLEGSAAAVEDFGSTNGTRVNGSRIQRRRQLKHGDRVGVGEFEFEVQLTGSASAAETPAVKNVQPAVARPVAASTAPAADLDISGWLDENTLPGNNSPKQASPRGIP